MGFGIKNCKHLAADYSADEQAVTLYGNNPLVLIENRFGSCFHLMITRRMQHRRDWRIFVLFSDFFVMSV